MDRRHIAVVLSALAHLVQLVRRMACLLVHGGNGLLVWARGQAEDLSGLGVQPVARVLNPGTLLGFDISLMRFGELLRRDVHPLVDVHECRHVVPPHPHNPATLTMVPVPMGLSWLI